MKKQKSRASLLPISELPETSFKLIQDRDEFIIKKRFEGHTLQEIGTSVGLTRERIRQIVQIKNVPILRLLVKLD
jgi:DNA-directed RNA polymerase sigma subunit (sigma70/sigma32)